MLHIEGVKVAETAEGSVWTGKAVWDGEADMDIHDAVNSDGEAIDARSTTTECVEWLQDSLTGKELPRARIVSAARKAGFSESTLKRAARKLKIVSTAHGFPRTTHWSLPVYPADSRTSSSQASAGESVLTELTGLTEGRNTSRASEASGVPLQNGDLTATAADVLEDRRQP